MNCLFSNLKEKKTQLMGNKVQNKGVGEGWFSIYPVLCSPQVLILLPPARASSPFLSSPKAQIHPCHFNLCPTVITSSVERFSWRHF